MPTVPDIEPQDFSIVTRAAPGTVGQDSISPEARQVPAVNYGSHSLTRAQAFASSEGTHFLGKLRLGIGCTGWGNPGMVGREVGRSTGIVL